MRIAPRFTLLSLVQITLLAACGTEPAQRVLAPSAELAARPQHDDGDEDSEADSDDRRLRFSDWSAPVNLGPPVNTAFAEQAPAISKDGLSLYFHCLDCPGGYGGFDIWVSERASVEAPWGAPRNLGPAVNTSFAESSPALSRDGRALFFGSTRPDGFGAGDVYVARRDDKRDNLGWEAPVNLGPGVNTVADEGSPEFFRDDEGRSSTLYFGSSRVGGPGEEDIYASPLLPDGTFGPPVLVEGLNTPFRDTGPTIRRDGLEVFFVSERPGGLGGPDIWGATRATISDPWSTPVNLGPLINTDKADAGPALSFDATTLYFHSAFRSGNIGGPRFDIWVATRSKLKGRDKD